MSTPDSTGPRVVSALLSGASGVVAGISFVVTLVGIGIWRSLDGALGGPIGDLGDLYTAIFGILALAVVAPVTLVAGALTLVTGGGALVTGIFAFYRRARTPPDGS